MPLNVGNIYVYQWTAYMPPYTFNGKYRVKITKDTLILNKRYFYNDGQPDFPNPFSGNPFQYRWLRVDSTKENLIGFYLGSECVIDSFAAKKNDTETCCYGRIPCVDTGAITLFSNYQTYKIGFQGNLLSGFSNGYAKNIGMYGAGRGEFGPGYGLNGCVINGIVYGDTSFLISGVNKIASDIPESFALFQNYPNPFNPTTKIKFSIPLSRGLPERRGVFTRLIVYDLLGNEVATLVNENLNPGTYEVTWDASNFASGIYFYKLETENFSETKKLILLK